MLGAINASVVAVECGDMVPKVVETMKGINDSKPTSWR